MNFVGPTTFLTWDVSFKKNFNSSGSTLKNTSVILSIGSRAIVQVFLYVKGLYQSY